MWSIEFPFDKFPEKLPKFGSKFRKVNHIPGIICLINKLSLSTTTDSKYVQKSFYFPRDKGKFDDFVVANPEKKFVVKNFDNRGVVYKTSDEINAMEINKMR